MCNQPIAYCTVSQVLYKRLSNQYAFTNTNTNSGYKYSKIPQIDDVRRWQVPTIYGDILNDNKPAGVHPKVCIHVLLNFHIFIIYILHISLRMLMVLISMSLGSKKTTISICSKKCINHHAQLLNIHDSEFFFFQYKVPCKDNFH